MSIVHSCEDTQTVKRDSGRVAGRPKVFDMVSPATATAFARAVGTLRVGGSTPCVRRSCSVKSRKPTGSPSVTK
jgi:hypothetical protein